MELPAGAREREPVQEVPGDLFPALLEPLRARSEFRRERQHADEAADLQHRFEFHLFLTEAIYEKNYYNLRFPALRRRALLRATADQGQSDQHECLQSGGDDRLSDIRQSGRLPS